MAIRLIIEVQNDDELTLDKWQHICQTDQESIEYLQALEDSKMQVIYERLGWGKYRRSKIIANHHSVHNHASSNKIKCTRLSAYREAVKANLIHTKVEITHL